MLQVVLQMLLPAAVGAVVATFSAGNAGTESWCRKYLGYSSQARCWWHWTLLPSSAFGAAVAAVCAGAGSTTLW